MISYRLFEGVTSNGCLYTRNKICGMLKEKNYQSVDKLFQFLAACIDWRAECEKKPSNYEGSHALQ